MRIYSNINDKIQRMRDNFASSGIQRNIELKQANSQSQKPIKEPCSACRRRKDEQRREKD